MKAGGRGVKGLWVRHTMMPIMTVKQLLSFRQP